MPRYTLRFTNKDMLPPKHEIELHSTDDFNAIWESYLKIIEGDSILLSSYSVPGYAITLFKISGDVNNKSYEILYEGNFLSHKFTQIESEIINNYISRTKYLPNELRDAFSSANQNAFRNAFEFPKEYAFDYCIYNKMMNEWFPSVAVFIPDNIKYMMIFEVMKTIGKRERKDYNKVFDVPEYTVHLLIKSNTAWYFDPLQMTEIINAFNVWESMNKISISFIDDETDKRIIVTLNDVRDLSIFRKMHLWFDRHDVQCSFHGIGTTAFYDYVEFNMEDPNDSYTFVHIPNMGSIDLIRRNANSDLYETLCNYYDREM